MRIQENYGPGYQMLAQTENVSSIIDRMVRLAATLTESYASGIVYASDMLKKVIEKHEPLSVILSFRENGVDRYPMEILDILTPVSFGESLQQWLLTVQYCGNTPTTIFKRVTVFEN